MSSLDQLLAFSEKWYWHNSEGVTSFGITADGQARLDAGQAPEDQTVTVRDLGSMEQVAATIPQA